MRTTAEAACDPHEEILRRLKNRPGFGVTQQIAIAHGLHAEVLKEPVALGANGVIEFAGVQLHEVGDVVADQPRCVTCGDRLRKRKDVLVLNFFVDVGRQQTRREL